MLPPEVWLSKRFLNTLSCAVDYCVAAALQFGDYPAFWQELQTWPHYKTVYRRYLQFTETGKLPATSSSSTTTSSSSADRGRDRDRDRDRGGSSSSRSSHDKDRSRGDDRDSSDRDGAQRKRRKSRWGTERAEPSSSSGGGGGGSSSGGGRSSRWGAKAEPPVKRSRWGARASRTQMCTCMLITNPHSLTTYTHTHTHTPVALCSARHEPAATGRPNHPHAARTRQPTVRNCVSCMMRHPPPSMRPLTPLRVCHFYRLMNVVQIAKQQEANPDRSPSPPPRYDSNVRVPPLPPPLIAHCPILTDDRSHCLCVCVGMAQGKRTNTRDQRLREKLMEQRTSLMAELSKVDPTLARHAGARTNTKITKKLYIPIKEYPNYNFIGLIIGPRGNTQKRLERETGCKVSIRGRVSFGCACGVCAVLRKSSTSRPPHHYCHHLSVCCLSAQGSVKDGRGRRDGRSNPDDNDDLHVLITGEKQENVAHAEKIIADLLVPKEDDAANEWKMQQLRELALINGTVCVCECCAVAAPPAC